MAVDDDANAVAVAQLAERAAGQCLRADVTDAGPGADAGKTGVGDQGHFAPPREMLEGRGDLINLLHARAHRSTPHEHDDVARLDRPHLAVGGIANSSYRVAF